MTRWPLVSVVTPSLNQARFIGEAISSVLSQEYPYIEYLVVDGGSTDETPSVLRSFGSRLRWVSESDEGQSQAINKGWRMTQGEIITWLNADDVLAPGAVDHAVKALLAVGEEIAGVYGDCVYIDEGGHPKENYPSRSFDYTSLVVTTENFIPQPGTFLRRKWVERVGMLDETLHYVMDYDLWLRMGMYASFIYLPREMSRARLHAGAKTLASVPRFGEELARVFARLVDHADFPPALRRQRNVILSNAFIHAASFCFWGGVPRCALQYLSRAWQRTPLPRSRSFWLLLLFSLAGRVGWRLAERLHGNPFRLERGWLR